MSLPAQGLPDILPVNPGLDVLFVAKTPAPKSVAQGHYFQGRQGQYFWNQLKKYGIFNPTTDFEDDSLLENDFGMTDIVKHPHVPGDEPTADEYQSGIARILHLIEELQPRVVVFVYKSVLDNILRLKYGVDRKSRYGFNPDLQKRFGSQVFVFPMNGTPCSKEIATSSMRELALFLSEKSKPRNQELTLTELLQLRGLDTSKRIKLVRHQSSNYDLQEMERAGWLEYYQAAQGEPVFDNCELVIGLLGSQGTHARFFGVYAVGERLTGQAMKLPPECPHQELRNAPHFYEMRKLLGYEDLEGRIIIDWGRATRSWHQHLRPKPVVEVLPQADGIPVFRDYQELRLTHKELVRIFQNEEAHREWKARLSSVAGIYLIVDSGTGAQYVGSAYGELGFWGRWKTYAKTGHGGNLALRALVEDKPQYPGAFEISILHVLPRSMTRSEVIKWESLYKDKLGSRAIGLNLN